MQKALNALMAQQAGTCIAIAHRLSTIMDSAKIAVVKDKHVLEEGSHAELVLKPDGACAARSRTTVTFLVATTSNPYAFASSCASPTARAPLAAHRATVASQW